MFDKAKLNRGEEKSQGAPKKPHEQAAAPEAAPRGPDMPELGGGAPALAGTKNDAVDKAENDPAQIAEQQKELARLKALPAGSPELEAHKKPEAAGAKVPEGNANTKDAKSDAAGMSPKNVQGPPATLGANNVAVSKEPGGDKVEVQKVALYSEPPVSGPASQGAALAGGSPPAATAPAEKSATEAADPVKVQVSPEAAEKKEAPAPTQLNIEAPKDGGPAEPAGAEPAKSPEGKPEAVKTGDAAAEGKAGKEPEKSPEKQPEKVAGAAHSGDSAGDIKAPDGGEAKGGDVAPIAVATADGKAAKEAGIAELPVKLESVAAVSLPGELAGKVDAVPEVSVAAAAAPSLAAPSGAVELPGGAAVAPVANAGQVAAPEAKIAAPAVAEAKAGSGGAEGVKEAAPVLASQGVVQAENAPVAAAPDASPGTAPAGANDVVGGKSAGDGQVVAPPKATDGQVAAPGGSAPQAAGPKDAHVDAAGDAAGVALAAVPAVAGVAAITDGGPVGDAVSAAGKIADEFGGRVAASELGEKVLGLTADNAAVDALKEPLGLNADRTDAIAKLSDTSGQDPSLDDAAAAAALKKQVDSLTNGVAGGAQAAAGAAGAAGVAGANAAGAAVAGLVDPAKKAVDEAKDKGADALGKLSKNPGENVKSMLGEGKKLAGGVKDKAEQALGQSLGDVRLHAGERAEELADLHGATAFAQGADIVMGSADKLAAGDREQVLAEEVMHVAQMGGEQAASRGATGVSSATDKSEKAARTAAKRVLQGAKIDGIGYENERRALYRNDGPAPAAGDAKMPEKVQVSIGGKTVTVMLPKMTLGTTSKSVTLPSMGITGLTLERSAIMKFNKDDGKFMGGTAHGDLVVGTTMKAQNQTLQIDQNGVMKSTFKDATLTVGSLIDYKIDATVGASGVTGKGTIRYSDLNNPKLKTWLTSGTMEINVAADGAATGSGSLGIKVGDFTAGTLKAGLANEKISGAVTIQNESVQKLGKAEVSKGALTGQLTDNDKVTLSGSLDLTIPALGEGTGKAQITWDSETEKISGTAAYTGANSVFGKVKLVTSVTTGTIADSLLTRMDGNGKAVYDALFEGDWTGGVDIDTKKVDFTLGGKLQAPITQDAVTVSGGALTIQVAQSELTSTSGNVDFKHGGYLKGTAVLEEGTNANNINATATAELVAVKTEGNVTFSKGSMTVKVQGTKVEIVSGSVDLGYKDVATGQLNLTASSDVQKLSGNAKANLNAGLQWGDIKVLSGSIDLDLKDNVVTKAQGQMKMGYLTFVEGTMSFDATKDFTSITGTATASLSDAKPLTKPLTLLADASKTFDLNFKNSKFEDFKGAFSWQYDKFSGDVTVVNPLKDFGLITGEGKADLNADMPIGKVAGGSELMGKAGSSLTGVMANGIFTGVKGTLKWQYQDWLAGEAAIAQPRQTIESIDGTMAANVIAPKALPGNEKVEIQPGGTLQVRLDQSKPTEYSGKLDYIYDKFLKGSVTVAGKMLNFSNLAGKSAGEVIAAKEMKNAEIQIGSTMNVEFIDSKFDTFDGNINVIYDKWLKGTVTAVNGGGSSMSMGVAGKATGTLLSTPPGDNGDFKILEGGDVKFTMAANMPVKTFDAGSKINWEYGKPEAWLGGALTLDLDAQFRSPGGKTDANILKDHDLEMQPKFTLLPSVAATEITAGLPTKMTGSVAASVDDWVKGTFAIGAGSGMAIFNGTLTGAVSAEKPLTDELTLIAGGVVDIKVTANKADGISGTIPFKYKAGKDFWIEGTVKGQSAEAGGGLKNISGEVTASVSAPHDLGSMITLEQGGTITATMTNSHIDKILGNVNWKSKAADAPGWIGGTLELGGASTTTMVSGEYTGSILTDTFKAGLKTTLQPGGGVTGNITDNTVKTIAGPVSWSFDSWIKGNVTDAGGVDPKKIGGTGPATVFKKTDIVPGHLWLMEGGDLTAKLTDGTFTSMSGTANYNFEDWLHGTITVTDALPGKLVGPAKGSVFGAGKTFGSDMTAVKLHPGGDLTLTVEATSIKDVSGTANVEYGQANAGDTWHMKGTGVLANAQAGSYVGTVDGPLMSPRKFPPSLEIQLGGTVGGTINGTVFTGIHGDVNYTFNRSAKPFIEGKLGIAASSTNNSLSGTVGGTVVAPQSWDKFTIQPGGKLAGTLTNNNTATLAGDLQFLYDSFISGKLTVDTQINPDDPKINAKASATTIGAPKFGDMTVMPGSSVGAQIKNSAVTNLWGKLNFTSTDFLGVVDVPEGESTPTEISGDATVTLIRDKKVGGSELYIRGGTSLKIGVVKNQFKKISGSVDWRYMTFLKGNLTVEGDADLTAISGSGSAELTKRTPVGSTGLALMPGSGINAKIVGGNLDGVGGKMLWEYGPGGWLGGDITVPDGTKIDNPSGSGTASLRKEQQFGALTLQPGGSLTVQVANAEPTSFGGKVLWAYDTDKWLTGDVTIADGSKLDKINGSATATIAKEKQVGSSLLKLQPGGSLTLTMANSEPGTFAGDVNWLYDTWLQGKVTVAGGSKDDIKGEATASLKTAHSPAGSDLELQEGGSLQVTVGNSEIKEFGGSVNWKYGAGEKWVEGALTVAGKSSFDSITAKASAHLIKDMPLGEVLLKAGGSHLEVDIAASKITTFGGAVEYMYDAGEQWVHGTITVDPGSTEKSVSGKATGVVEKPHQVGASELTIDVGSNATVVIANNEVKNFGGLLKWTYGADPWLKGTIEADASSTPDKITGAVTGTLSSYKRLSDDIRLKEGGTFKAQFDGTELKQFDGDVTVEYQDWIEGNLHIQNSNLESVSGSMTATLVKIKDLGDEFMLKRGGTATVELADNTFAKFSGDVGWQYQQWLEGSLHVDVGADMNVSGTGTATLKEQKMVGDKLELQRGGALRAKVTNSKVDGVGGDFMWIYDTWLKGSVSVADYAQIETVSGSITASVAEDKPVGKEITLKKGGSVTGNLKGGTLATIGGNVEWQYQDWLAGSVVLNESPLDHLSGKATASILKRKEVKAPMTIEAGGSMTLDFDTQQSLVDAPFAADLTWEYDKWLGGTLTADAGSTFSSLNGTGTAALKTDKQYGDVTLNRGGELRVKMVGSLPDSFGGDLNWQYQSWLAGTINVADGSKLDSLTGKATASVIKPQPVGGKFALKEGGSVEANLAASKLTTFGGTAYFTYEDALKVDGSIDIAKTSTPDSITGKATATLAAPYAVGGTEFIVQPGTSVSVDVAASQFGGVTGDLKWKYQSWAQGGISVNASDLKSISGRAEASIVGDKPLVGGFKLTPGGSAHVEVKANALEKWGGNVNWKYNELVEGSLEIDGEQDLASVSGKGDARLINDLDLGKGVKLLNGSGVQVEVGGGKFKSLSGKVRFQYETWLTGAIDLVNSTPESINGSASASLLEPYSPGGGEFGLLQGGNIKVEFANSAFTDIEGIAEWEYKNPKAQLDGRISIQKSPVTSITGEATARLLADTEPVKGVKLMQGGRLNVKVAASKPESFGGRVDWDYNSWLGGYVEVPDGTPITGPYTGSAGASIKEEQTYGKFVAQKGGNLNLQLDTGAGVENTTFDGTLAVEYDKWLLGTLQADAGSSFKQMNGKAKMELTDEKTFGKFKLLKGGNAEVGFAGTDITTFGGTLLVEYDNWLAGSINVNTNSTPDSITGKATLAIKTDQTFGDFTLREGGQLTVDVANSTLGGVSGMLDWRYQKWVEGNLTVSSGSTLESIGGQGSAHVIEDKPVGGGVIVKKDSNAHVTVAASAVSGFGGEVKIEYDKWLDGVVIISGESDLKTVSGTAHVRVKKAKEIGGGVTLKEGSSVTGVMDASAITSISGTVDFEWNKKVEGSLTVASSSTLDSVSGHAQVGLMETQNLGGGVELLKGGNASADFDGTKVTHIEGQLALMYDKWLKGSITASTGASLDEISGKAVLSVETAKKFNAIEIAQGSTLEVDFAANTVTEFRGNVDVGYEEWLKGNLNFKAQDLNSISGSGSLNVIHDHLIVSPVSILEGSYVKVNFENSKLKDFGGTARVGVKDWGTGELTVRDGSTTESVSGSGKITLSQPKKLGEHVTLTHAEIGADLEANEIKSIYGRADAEVKDFGNGWVQIDKASTLTSFDGQAGLKLTTPKKIGSFAELSGGEIIANFQANSLKDFGGKVDITVYGWGKGNVTIDAGSTMDHIKGSASIELTEKKSLAGGKVQITGGKVSAAVDGQKLTQIAGMVEIELTGIAKGKVSGELNVEKELFSGSGKLEQIAPWRCGPVTIENAKLSAVVTDNKLTGASGSADIDAGKIGKGKFEVNYEDVGGEAIFYGKGEINFKPHDRVDGTIKVNYSRDKKLTGEGQVNVKISDKISGMAGVALDEQGHVKIKGSVTIPGPYELFKPDPYKKDITLLDLSFVVYTPPTVKVKVGAGLGIEAGIKPLTISNIVLAGECDLMEPSFASLSVTGHLASSAYVDLNAYIQGSVQISAAVVAVEAGLRASLNLHLEAALSADPTITCNRNGLSFDMPVEAKLTAALNLILSFFAKVKVGIDVGLFSIMKTVWNYEKSPDPIKLAEMSIGAKGRVQAGPGGFTGTMNPEYTPPDMSLDTLKKALHID